MLNKDYFGRSMSLEIYYMKGTNRLVGLTKRRATHIFWDDAVPGYTQLDTAYEPIVGDLEKKDVELIRNIINNDTS